MGRIFLLGQIMLWAAPIFAQAPGDLDRLPVKRVVLYKNGVGYFEHLGPVKGNQDVAISFTSGQLNDVLKSLTVLDLNGGRIAGVAYGSAAPVDRQLGDLRLPIGEKTTLTEFLGALRGARLEIHSATGSMTGRLLSVERKTRMGGGATLEVDYVSLLTENGEVKTAEVSPSFSVRLLDKGLPAKVDRYLDIAGANREADVRRMVISAEGTGDRSLFVSYISEVPVWKATYRIVLNPKKSPLLQGWAIVDNTVGQDWEHVQLSLVAGAPQSFIQNLSQPYYARRPVVALPEMAALAPQTYEATLVGANGTVAGTIRDPSGAVIPGARVKVFDANGTLAGETIANASGRYELALPAGVARVEVEQQGFRKSVMRGVGPSSANDVELQIGQTAETVEVRASAATLNTMNASVGGVAGRNLGNGGGLGGGVPINGRNVRNIGGAGGTVTAANIDAARSSIQSAASAQELGDLFEYKLKDPITILKNRSALVPIVQSTIAADKVSVWNERGGYPRPQRALWLNNTSGLTLDGGSFSVLEEETFAGEGLFDPIKPGEKRLVSYATDLALNVRAKSETDQDRVTRASIVRGVMTLYNESTESRTYTFRNEDTTPRTVVVEHPVRSGYELRGDAKPVETTSAWMRFQVHVDPKQTASLMVKEARPMQTTYEISTIGEETLTLFVRQKSIDKSIEDALRKVIAAKAGVDALDNQKEARNNETQKIFNDQQRLRENMKALKGSPEEKSLLQRYTKQLNDEEDRLEKLRKELEEIDAKQEKAQDDLDKMIEALVFDVRV